MIAADRLKSYIERIEKLEEEKKALSDDIKDIYTEAKAAGFTPKVMREIIKLRKQDAADREEHEMLLDTYKQALGMLADTPLGEAAKPKRHEKASAGANAQPGSGRASPNPRASRPHSAAPAGLTNAAADAGAKRPTTAEQPGEASDQHDFGSADTPSLGATMRPAAGLSSMQASAYTAESMPSDAIDTTIPTFLRRGRAS